MATIAEIAEGMLSRYSSPKVALEMAQLHAHDSSRPAHWRAVAAEIMRRAGIGPDGSPRSRTVWCAGAGMRGLWRRGDRWDRCPVCDAAFVRHERDRLPVHREGVGDVRSR